MKSTVDWCEDNYVYTRYIAEIWNSASSVALMYAGFHGFIRHRQFNGNIIFAILFGVGLGSVLFHSCLTATTQMMDEIPMIFLLSQLLINVCNLQSFYRIIVYTFATAYSIFIYHSTNAPSFEFIMFQLSIIVSSIVVFVKLVVYTHRDGKEQELRLFLRGTTIFLMGWSCWLVDFFMCSLLQKSVNPQLHAWWHVLSAIGVYRLSLMSLMVNNNTDVDSNPKYSMSITGNKIFPVIVAKMDLNFYEKHIAAHYYNDFYHEVYYIRKGIDLAEYDWSATKKEKVKLSSPIIDGLTDANGYVALRYLEPRLSGPHPPYCYCKIQQRYRTV